MKDAVVVAYGRSAVGKAPKGRLRETRPDDVAAQVLKKLLARLPIAPELVEDVIMGCSFPEAEQGMNVARTVALRAGLPVTACGQTINRFCSSGLQSVAIAANSIRANEGDVIVAGGLESMSLVPMYGRVNAPNPYMMGHEPQTQASMGITAENVAAKYGISREEQDEFALASHHKASAAQKAGRFESQIIPVDAVETIMENGRPRQIVSVFEEDEGIRHGISMENLAKLRPVFKKGGGVTAGNASQMSDGAAMVVMMSHEKANELGIKPLARLTQYAVAGVEPSLMGIGPVYAIPKALAKAGLCMEDISLLELNEAFAAQSIACIRELGLDESIVNVNGGAIALGHPLGCTGAFLTAKLLDEMALRDARYGMVSMCIGGGMGAAAIFERL